MATSEKPNQWAQQIIHEMDDLEEMGGPEPQEYIEAMTLIAEECLRRVRACSSHIKMIHEK